jgi:hypothetical protein
MARVSPPYLKEEWSKTEVVLLGGLGKKPSGVIKVRFLRPTKNYRKAV